MYRPFCLIKTAVIQSLKVNKQIQTREEPKTNKKNRVFAG